MIVLGVGWFGTHFFWGFNSAAMPLFLRNFTDSKFTISLVLSLAGVTGCIVPPITGYLSDRSFTRFGRRRPYIFLGILGVLICLLGLPHAGGIQIAAAISGLMYFCLRAAETPYLSLLPDITPPPQRGTTSGVMNLFSSLGLITYFVISSRIWDTHPAAVFRMVAVISFGAILTTVILIREPKFVRLQKPAERASLSKYLNGITMEANALKFFIAQFFWWLGFWMVSTFATLFVSEGLNVSQGKSFLVLLTFSIVATLFMLPLGMLGDRLGRKAILSFMIVFWAVCAVAVGLSQNLTHAVITLGLNAIPYAAVMGVGYAYLLDLIPRERTAEFVGFSVISIASAQILGSLGGGKLIDTLGYRSIFPTAAICMIIGFTILQFIGPAGKPIPSHAQELASSATNR